MKKNRRSNFGQVAAKIRKDAVTDPGLSVELRRRLVADLCKLLGDKPPVAATYSATADLANQAAVQNEPALPPRLRQTLDYLLTGDSEKQIARKLSLSQNTVHVYVKSLYRKFNVSSRGELLARWIQR